MKKIIIRIFFIILLLLLPIFYLCNLIKSAYLIVELINNCYKYMYIILCYYIFTVLFSLIFFPVFYLGKSVVSKILSASFRIVIVVECLISIITASLFLLFIFNVHLMFITDSDDDYISDINDIEYIISNDITEINDNEIFIDTNKTNDIDYKYFTTNNLSLESISDTNTDKFLLKKDMENIEYYILKKSPELINSAFILILNSILLYFILIFNILYITIKNYRQSPARQINQMGEDKS